MLSRYNGGLHLEVVGGTAGWSYEDWVGPFYPVNPPKGFSRLSFYSGFFDCVEVNSTFYRHFSPAVAEKWLREVESNDRFVFLVKLYRSFTHGRADEVHETSAGKAVVSEFLAPFAESQRLGGLLVQFSEYFRDTPMARDRISSIIDGFAGIKLFLELRHSSWYTDKASKFIADRHAEVIAIDQPGLEGMVGLGPAILGEVGYFRLHGRNQEAWELGRKSLAQKRSARGSFDLNEPGRNERYNYLYSGPELDEIEAKIRKAGERCNRIYVVANNHPMGKAVANALELIRRLRNQERVRMPETVIKYFPELEKTAEKVSIGPQDLLF